MVRYPRPSMHRLLCPFSQLLTLLAYPALLCVLANLVCLPGKARADANTSRTLQLVTDSACQSQIPALLDQWEADRRAEGWKVLKRIVAGGDAAALQTKLGSIRPDHTFLVGDNIPFLKVSADPDGHGAREIAADYKYVQDAQPTPFGAVGRIWFKTQHSADVPSMDLYRRYFTKRHTWPADQVTFGPVVRFDDHLSYRPDGAMWAKLVMEQPPSEHSEHVQLPQQDPDGELTRLAKSPRLIEVVFSGGQPFANPGGLYYFGGAASWRNADPNHPGVGPRVAILGAFGSFLCEIEWADSFLTAALTTKHTVASFYDFHGVFPFGKMFTGSTIGDCGRAAASKAAYISNVYGDPTGSIAHARSTSP
jgi:hypothetical protein